MSDWTRDLRPKNIEGIDYHSHVEAVEDFFVNVATGVHAKRENTYKMSFAKRGLSSIWLNLARKYDRIDPIMTILSTEAGDDKSILNNSIVLLIDTLFDCAMYALKFLVILKELYPDAYNNWLDNVNKR